MKRLLALPTLLLFLTLLIAPAPVQAAGTTATTPELATQAKKDGYYLLTVDLSQPGCSRHAAGVAHGAKIKEAVNNYESLLDSYFVDFLTNNENYNLMLSRMQKIWPNTPQTFRDELDGMAESLCSTQQNVLGDGLLSPDELRLFNLTADVLRATSCSAVGVLAQSSTTGNVITARNLDWDDGKTFQLSGLQAVLNYKLPNSDSLTLVGYLGLIIGVSGYSSHATAEAPDAQCLYFALLDSDIGGKYSDEHKRSYPADLRAYAEVARDIDAMTKLLNKTAADYTFGHLVFLADTKDLGVYEDNLTYAENRLRRVADNPDLYLPWRIPQSIGAVNCYMLKTSLDNVMGAAKARDNVAKQNLLAGDNTLYVGNKLRWATQQRLLAANGDKHSLADLKQLAGYGPGKATDGFIYRPSTLQIVIFEPATRRLEVAFHPIGRDIQDGEKPVFTPIPNVE